MRILTRYLIREMTGTTLLGFFFYTVILLMQNLMRLAELIISRSLPASTVGRLLLLSLPNIVVLTIPMALLVGILIAVGRLSADSEIVAMRAAGLSAASIYKPVLYFSAAVFLVNLYIMNFVLPRGNTALRALSHEITGSAAESRIEPRIFYDQFPNWIVYINDADETGRWRGVFLADASNPESQKIVVAERGKLVSVGPEKHIWAELENARTYLFSQLRPERYDVNTNAQQRFLLSNQPSVEAQKREVARGYRELDLQELVVAARAARNRDPIDYRLALVEIHKKLSIPFACLAFGIIGLPLGITNRRGGKSSGFSLSLAIILFYYATWNNGEDLAQSGKLHPAISMWLPNIVVVLLGIYLLRRANMDAGSSNRGWFGGRLSALFSRRKKTGAAAAPTGERVPILSRLDIPFPNILDRYVIAQFVRILLLVIVSIVSLFILVDYMTQISGEAARHQIKWSVVASYYRYYAIEVLDLTLPMSILVATLVTFGILSRNNEVTAFKAHGISLYRVALPIIVIAIAMSGVSYLLTDFVLPHSEKRVEELKARIKGREVARAVTVQQRQWVFGRGRYLFNFLNYDRNARSLMQVQVFEFAPNEFRLTRQVWAEEARFDGVAWMFFNGWSRTINADGTTTFEKIIAPIRLPYSERPEYFATEAKTAQQMTYAELKRYIETLQISGYAANEHLVQLYRKLSWPAISIVMALIAIPFSFRMGKRGALYGIGIAFAVAFVYWVLFGLFMQFGEVGSLPALLAAWSANIVFSLAALYLFLHVET